MKLHKDLREFVELLASNSVEFVIVGGHAVAFHGHPRFTGDIDVLVRATTDNATRLLAALAQFGASGLGLSISDFTTPGNVVQLGRPPNRIDLLTSITGVDYDEVWAGRASGRLDGLPVAYIGWDALLKNKQASARPKDVADVAKLQEIRGRRA